MALLHLWLRVVRLLWTHSHSSRGLLAFGHPRFCFGIRMAMGVDRGNLPMRVLSEKHSLVIVFVYTFVLLEMSTNL